MVTGQQLQERPLRELEALYQDSAVGPVPAGRFRGQALHRVDTRFARSLTATALLVPFERLPFGIDFDARRWFFLRLPTGLGHFRIEPGRSRWRATDTLKLIYDVSRLPLRGLLYDEVKPLSDTLCLGLGGLNRGAGTGELFYFLLEAERA